MAKLRPIEYAVLLHPKEVKNGKAKEEDTIFIVEPTTVLAEDQDSLSFKVAREIPAKYEKDFKRMQIVIRDF